MNYESVIKKIGGTSTDDRKEGLRELLDSVKSFSKNDDNNSENGKSLYDTLKDKTKGDNLLKSLGRLLRDPDWEIKRDALEVVLGVLMKEILGHEMESLILPIVPHVISCLSDSKMTVRKGATQCLHELWLKTRDLTRCLHSFVEHGLHRSLDLSQRRDNNLALQVLLTSHFSSSHLTPVIDGVLLQLELDPDDDRLVAIVSGVLRSVKKLIGEERFSQYLEQAAPQISALYNRCLTTLDLRNSSIDSRNTVLESNHSTINSRNSIINHRNSISDSRNATSNLQNNPSGLRNSTLYPSNNNPDFPNHPSDHRNTVADSSFFMTALPPSNNFQSKKLPSLTSQTADVLHLGFIPHSVIIDINNNKNLEAIEEIHNLFTKLYRDKQLAVIIPHLQDLILLIQRLMEEKYLVIMTAFKLLIDLVGSLSQEQVNTHLDSLLQLLRMALTHNMNGDAIIQKYIMAYSMIIFQKCNTILLVTKLCDQHFMLDMKQASVRQTSIDIIISALLKFPSTKFDLDFLTSKISQRLTDKKQKVKQAALECISVIGYTYGNGKVNAMLKIIEQSTKSDPINAITELVQNRLSKHRLPHVDDHGLVVYVTETDKTNSQRQCSIIDMDQSSSDNSPISSANPLEKRRPSAGKVRGRAKFPWDQNEGNAQNSGSFTKAPGITSLNQIQPSDTIPIQFSQGSIANNNKQMLQDGKMIRKLNDLQSDTDHDLNSSRNQPISGRSYSSEFNPSTLTNTSGYSSNSNSSRRYTESFVKYNHDNSTATNSVNVTPRNPSTSRFEDNNLIDQSPIPTKPTLGRSAGSRRKDVDLMGQPLINNDDHRMDINEPKKELINSTMLDSVRNSAAKKKALTIFNSSSQKSSPTNTMSTIDQSAKVAQSILTNGTKAILASNYSNKISEAPVGYNPYKGATFKPNPQYDGQIVGKSVTTPAVELTEQLLKKKQPVKGVFDAAAGNVSQRSVANHQQSDNKKTFVSSEPMIVVNNVAANSDSPRNSKATTTRTSMNSQKELDFNEGIVGKGIADRNGPDDESDEESHKGIMSNTLRESLSMKRQKAANELNSSKSENNIINPMPPSPHSAPGSGSYQAMNRKPPVGSYYHNNNLPASAGNERDVINDSDTAPLSRKPLRPALGNSTPKKVKPLSQTLTNPTLNPLIDPTNATPAPLSNPDKSIVEFLHMVQNEDWENKVAALTIAQSLAQYHPETLANHPTDLHAICIAICKECKNLRSQVAKSAIQTVGILFTNLRKTMDQELDVIIINMLSKGGDSSSIFLRQDVELTLSVMIDNVTPQRAIIPLITNGADNKNAAIRRLVASNIMQITEKLGAIKILSGAKEITEKLLSVVGKFIMDSNQETRYFSKRILLELSKNPEFEKIAIKSIPAKDVRILSEAIENLKLKGIGDPPQFSQSASIRRSGSISRGASAGNLVSLEQKASTLSRGNSRSMSRLPGSEFSADDDDWLSKTCSDLSSSDFRFRQNGLESLINRQESFGLQIPQRGLSKLLTEFIPRLNDNNSKVAVTALTVCRKIIPSICSIFPTEFLSRLINTIALNFSSKSAELRESASIIMAVCFSHFDSNLLIQPCVEAMNKANIKSKVALIENMNCLLLAIINSKTSASSRSCGTINRHVAPQIGLLLEQNRPLPVSMKESLHKLVSLTYQIVGSELIETASRERNHTVKQAIIEILNNHSVVLS